MKMNQKFKTMLLWIALLLLVIGVYNFVGNKNTNQIKLNFSKFVSDLEDGKIKEVTFKGENKILGKYKDKFNEGKSFEITAKTDSEIFKLVKEKGGFFPDFEKEEDSPMWQQILISWGPMIFLFVLFMIFLKRLQSGNGKAMSFGKSRARMLKEDAKKVTFKDVAGVEEAKEELQEFIDFLKSPEKYTKLGGRIPKGVILMGSPGTGKTLLARAVAGEANVPFFSISGSDFVEMFVGVGASRVRDLFEQGKKHSPCIIFIDEIDAVGRQRGTGLGGGHDEREQTLNQLLVEMDGFEANSGVILIAATNRPDVLDPALLRPGRFDRRVVVNVPDVKGREMILKVHADGKPLKKDVNLENIAKSTPGFTGADLENLMNESALIAARTNKKKIGDFEIEEAKDKVLMGVARKSMVVHKEEKYITAIHEAGHALVAKLSKETDPVHKVTIIPRGLAMGVTQTLPKDDRRMLRKEKALSNIKVLMGGRVAEEISFDSVTTGASNDIERATQIARKMVCTWGMSEKLGPLKWGNEHDQVFIGREFGTVKNYSEETAKTIDSEIRSIVDTCYKEVKDVLTKNKDKLEKIAKELVKKEILTAKDIDEIVDGK